MRVAIVHDWFDQVYGGSERTALTIAEMFPNADIFTMIFNDDKFGGLVNPKRLHTSWLEKIPKFLRKHHPVLLPFMPSAIERFDFSGYDIVISSSPAFSKNIITPPDTIHISYCHSPMRFAWDYWPQYLYDNRYGPIRRFLASKVIGRIRQWDLAGVNRVDYWLTNSETSARRIKKYYRVKDITILHPPADIAAASPAPAKRDFYVTLATLSSYKKIDLAIEAFNISGKNLVVIGDGPDRKRLETMANNNIRFLGFIDDKQKWAVLRSAKGLIFPQEEDFGLAPIDAMACGVPVIAYRRGGVVETVIEDKTGVFFDSQSASAINQAIERAETINFNTRTLIAQAKKFSKDEFKSKLLAYIKNVYKTHHAK